ncbi:hypothetical protein ACRRTK_022431 [Alexandromys fortis]
MRGVERSGELEARVGGPGRLRHGRYQVAVAGGGTSVIPACLELPRSCHSPGGGREGASRTRLSARQPPGWPLAAEPKRRGRAGCPEGLAARGARTRGGGCREAGGRRATRASAGGRARRKRKRGKDFGEEVRERGVVTAVVAMVTGGPDVAASGCDGALACRRKPEVRPVPPGNAAEVLFHVRERAGATPGKHSLPLRGRPSEAPGWRMLPRIHNPPEVAWRKPRSPGPPPTRKRKQT